MSTKETETGSDSKGKKNPPAIKMESLDSSLSEILPSQQ